MIIYRQRCHYIHRHNFLRKEQAIETQSKHCHRQSRCRLYRPKNDLIRFPFNPKDHFPDWQEGVSTLAIAQTDADGSPLDAETPAQFEPTIRELAWQTGSLNAGESAWYTVRVVDLPPNNRYAIKQKPAHLLIIVDNQVFTRYNFLGIWKPYFWPINGNYGTVVRGAGGGDHPHHTGLYLAYGGHGEGGSANIWSDWDEPPYGPCGKMLHQRFIRLTSGPVYAEFVEDLIYTRETATRSSPKLGQRVLGTPIMEGVFWILPTKPRRRSISGTGNFSSWHG